MFRFESHWLSYECCGEIVRDAWTEFPNSPIEQIKNCASKLSEWASVEFRGCQRWIKFLEKRLSSLQ